ncbi:ABC transporter ATP-binding protein [soil metagenome]
MSFLRIEGLRKRYGAVAALDGLDLDVAGGTRTAVVGPSGSGKTTLLRLIAGFELPDAGRIVLGDAVLADGRAGVPAHRRGIGFVAQDGALFPHLSVAGNIGFGMDKQTADREERIAALMDAVELERTMAARRPHELSGGQQQRVALARALARQPKLMLLDEPFSALDTGLRDSMRKMVTRVLGEAGVTAVLVTHDQAEALSFADQIAVLDRGRLIQAGTPREMYLRPHNVLTASFLGDAVTLAAELGDGVAVCALGRLTADTGARRGPGTVMVRPEQIRLSLASGADDAAASYGRVAEVAFGGALSTVALTLDVAPGAPLLLRISGVDMPAAGERVRITVLGDVHIIN